MRRRLDDIQGFIQPVERYPFVPEIRHRAGEHASSVRPLARCLPSLRRASGYRPGPLAFSSSARMDAMQLPGGEDRSVAVVAFGCDLVATPPRVPGMVGPFDFGRHARE